MSSTTKSERPRSWSTSVWPRLGAAPESNPSYDTASATSSDSPTTARSTNQTPPEYAGRALRAASKASLVFPLPPTPVSSSPGCGAALGRKRALALREHALGLAALDRVAAGAPLWRVHEAVFAILACESEPVDPRL